MFTRWLDCGADEPKPGIAIWCARLGEAQNAGELDAGEFVELLTPVLARDTFPLGSLYHLGHLLILVRFADGDRDRGFKFLSTVARTAKPPALRGKAAAGLQQFRPLTVEQRKLVMELWKEEKDPTVRQSLNVLLKSPPAP